MANPRHTRPKWHGYRFLGHMEVTSGHPQISNFEMHKLYESTLSHDLHEPLCARHAAMWLLLRCLASRNGFNCCWASGWWMFYCFLEIRWMSTSVLIQSIRQFKECHFLSLTQQKTSFRNSTTGRSIMFNWCDQSVPLSFSSFHQFN